MNDTQELIAQQSAIERLSNELNARLNALRNVRAEYDDTPEMVALIFAVGGLSQRHQEITLALAASSAAANIGPDVEHDA